MQSRTVYGSWQPSSEVPTGEPMVRKWFPMVARGEKEEPGVLVRGLQKRRIGADLCNILHRLGKYSMFAIYKKIYTLQSL